MDRLILAAFLFITVTNVALSNDASLSPDLATIMERIASNLKECESSPENINTMSQNYCYSDALEDADKVLISAVEKINSIIIERDIDYPSSVKDNREIIRRLEVAQRAWIGYRQADCSFVATSMLGGSGEAVSDMACEFEQTRGRLKFFLGWLEDNREQH